MADGEISFWFLWINGEIVRCLTITGDFDFGGKYWWADGIGFDSCATEFCVWFDGIIIPSRLLKDLFEERKGTFVVDIGVCIGWLTVVCGITGGGSTGLFTGSTDGCVFVKWLRAETSSSTIFDEGIWESDVDDTWDIWRFTWVFVGNEGSGLFEDSLPVDWHSSSI